MKQQYKRSNKCFFPHYAYLNVLEEHAVVEWLVSALHAIHKETAERIKRLEIELALWQHRHPTHRRVDELKHRLSQQTLPPKRFLSYTVRQSPYSTDIVAYGDTRGKVKISKEAWATASLTYYLTKSS